MQKQRRRCGYSVLLTFSLTLSFFPTRLPAQTSQRPVPAGPMTLTQVIDYALANYPAVRAAIARIAAAEAGIDLARTAYLPRTDMIAAANRATRNNVVGALFPQPIIPSISGPVLDSATAGSVWGSAGGALFSWEPFDFGFRRANIDVARAIREQANAGAQLTQYQVALTVADAFLKVTGAGQSVLAAQANLDRMQIFERSTNVLVQNQLRPGADESRAQAEVALARTQLIQAQEIEREAQATLAQMMGVAASAIQIDAASVLTLPKETRQPAAVPDKHPIAVIQNSVVDFVRAREKALDRSYFPRFNVQSAWWARGTGAQTNGQFLGGLNGLAPDRSNWAAGFSVTFPLFDFASLRERKRIEAANESAESARYDEIVQQLTGEVERAKARVEGARRVAENTPIQLEAARTAERQVRARYQSGLATVTDVADVQRLLLQAEIEDAVAQLNVWRALLAQTAAAGDITNFGR